MKNKKTSTQYKLNELVKIYTPSSFAKEYPCLPNEDQVVKFIYVPKKFDPNTFKVEYLHATNLKDGYALIEERQIEAFFLVAFLSSYIGKIFLSENNTGKKCTVKLSSLKCIPIPCLPDDAKEKFVALYNIVELLDSQYEALKNDRYLEFKKELFSELLDAIALEISVPKLFAKFDIEILDNWINLFEECSKEYPSADTYSIISYLTEALVSPTSLVYNNLKKMRVMIDIIVKQLKDKHELEDK